MYRFTFSNANQWSDIKVTRRRNPAQAQREMVEAEKRRREMQGKLTGHKIVLRHGKGLNKFLQQIQ